MKPVVVVDANALHGLKSLTGADFKTAAALARMGCVRLVVPDVVVQELARQGAKEVADGWSRLRNAISGFRGVASDSTAIGVSVRSTPLGLDPQPPADRTTFHAAMTAFFEERLVETPTCPDVPVSDLLARDLDIRKPFDENGKGFRDALIWETIRDLCDKLEGADTLVVFMTNNHKDFCAGKGRTLHTHLRDELRPHQRFDLVQDLTALLEHEQVAKLVESLRVVEGSLTPKTVADLVDETLSCLVGSELASTVGVYDGNGLYSVPIMTPLADTAFNDIDPDNGSIAFEVLRTSDDGEMTIRVIVEADATIEGFIDKGELIALDDDTFSYFEDWNRHSFRAIESHRVRFTLSADFAETTVGDIVLRVDGVEEM
ncbi:PIN domain-containing protein [Cellulomonas sp.]|uniref:PIN domain-containing protein n=1 Tax=Cellulomonas sp. TaxID=40001 RepID=UPI003BAAE253